MRPPPPPPIDFAPYSSQVLRKAVTCGVPFATAPMSNFVAVPNVKRVSPGFLTGLGKHRGRVAIKHDCTTGHGNSGSPVVDLLRGCVVGIHYSGVSGSTNYAEPVSELLRDHKISKLLKRTPTDQGVRIEDSIVGDFERPAFPASRVALANRLKTNPAKFANVLNSVGLLKVENRTGGPQTLGTAFVIAKNRIATAGYALKTLVVKNADGTFSVSKNLSGNEFAIKFKLDDREISVGRIIVAEDPIAILEIDDEIDSAKVRFSNRAPEMGSSVAVVGFPFRDVRNSIESQTRIFGDLFGQKSFCVGKVMQVPDGSIYLGKENFFSHDCSTLGGQGGGPLVDMESGQVVGMHYAGQYLMANYAVWFGDEIKAHLD